MLHFNRRYLAGSFGFGLAVAGALGAAARESLWGATPSFACLAGLGVFVVGLLWAMLAGQRDKLAASSGIETASELETLAGKAYRRAKQLVVFIVGVSLFVIGVAMIALPGPAIVMIPLSLVILGSEFAWAKRLLDQIKDRFPVIARKDRFPAIARGEEAAERKAAGLASSKGKGKKGGAPAGANA